MKRSVPEINKTMAKVEALAQAADKQNFIREAELAINDAAVEKH